MSSLTLVSSPPASTQSAVAARSCPHELANFAVASSQGCQGGERGNSLPAASAIPTVEPFKRPRNKRVTLMLEASTRAANRFGADVYSQILWMRLDGLGVDQISAALHCSAELVGEVVSLWQQQVALKERDDWQPRRRNNRRWANRPRNAADQPLQRAA